MERLRAAGATLQEPFETPFGDRIVFFTDDEKEAVVWTYELSGATAMRRITFGGTRLQRLRPRHRPVVG